MTKFLTHFGQTPGMSQRKKSATDTRSCLWWDEFLASSNRAILSYLLQNVPFSLSLNQGCTAFCYYRLHYFYLYEVRPPMSSSYIY